MCIIALDKKIFFNPKVLIFSYFSMKICVVGTHWKQHMLWILIRSEALLMSTPTIYVFVEK